MADQVREYNTNSTLFSKNEVSVKKEECQDEKFSDEKAHNSKAVIITDNGELQDHFICIKMEPHEESTTSDNIKTELSLSEVQYDTIHNNLKIGEVINADDVKIEFTNRLLYCEDCRVYRENYCVKCGMLVHILNKTVSINANNRLLEELPHNILEIRDCFGKFRIFALKVIPAGVRFGPFTGLTAAECPWKIESGKFVVNKNESVSLNWMQYINPARNISEKNLEVFQYEHELYYESTRQIEEGDELLVHFGEEYEDSLNINVEMDFIPTIKYIVTDVFACTFCCFGFSSKLYLAKHKTVCPGNADKRFSIEDLMQCPSCSIYLDPKEYTIQHQAYCCKRKDRKCVLRTSDDRMVQVSRRKTGQHQMYKCPQCKYKTKYKRDLKNHTNKHYAVKMYKCRVCCKRFKTKEVLRQHVENTNICASGNVDWEHSNIKTEHSCSQDEKEQFRCSLCEFRTKYKVHLIAHVKVKHLKEFKYKCNSCDYKAIWKYVLNRHIKTKHLKAFKYKCDICDYKTNFNSDLKKHIETRHLREFNYKCDICDYRSNRMSHLKDHIKVKHLKEFKYKCDTCDYKANLKSYLKAHVERRHLKEFKYKCDMCDYKANLKHDLNLHVAGKHLNKFKYECDACDYKTNLKSHMKTHVDTKHLKEFKHKCDSCDYKANLKCQLKYHIETKHLKEFKHKCETCEYKAHTRSDLRKHVVRRHLRELKYNCDACDFKTNSKSDLKQHKRIHI